MREAALVAAQQSMAPLNQDLEQDIESVLGEQSGKSDYYGSRENRIWQENAAYRIVSRVSRIVPILQRHAPDVIKQFGISAVVGLLVDWI